MMACALVGPIPGRVSNSSRLALLIFTVCPGANRPLVFPVGESALLDVVGVWLVCVVSLAGCFVTVDDSSFADDGVSLLPTSDSVVFFFLVFAFSAVAPGP